MRLAGRKPTVMSLHERTLDDDQASPSVVAWRARRLAEAGLSREMAEAVATDCSYDLHALLELVDRGCPAELGLRILAPLDRGAPPC